MGTFPEENLERRTSNIAPDNRLRGYVFTAMFAGIAAAGGYLLMFIPNVEIITAVLFMAGFQLGLMRGILASTVASIIYFGLNPQGTFPPLFVAQVIGIAAAPMFGNFYRTLKSKPNRWIYLALFAFFATLWYDLLTTIAYPLSVGFDYRGILVTLSLGIIPSLIHIIGNVIIFVILVPIIQKHLERFQYVIPAKQSV